MSAELSETWLQRRLGLAGSPAPRAHAEILSADPLREL